MSLMKWLGFGGKKKEKAEPDPLKDYTLDLLDVGCLVDYDMQTWEVVGFNSYDYDGSLSHEWVLEGAGGTVTCKNCGAETVSDKGACEYCGSQIGRQSASKVAYLEREEEGGEVVWTLTSNISLSEISEDVVEHALEHDDPPDTLTFRGQQYELDESGGGLFREDGKGEGQEFISWSYCAQDGKHVLYVTQWGEQDFRAVAGQYAEEYQFTNILPGAED